MICRALFFHHHITRSAPTKVHIHSVTHGKHGEKPRKETTAAESKAMGVAVTPKAVNVRQRPLTQGKQAWASQVKPDSRLTGCF